jgi:RNA polymerase sigma-70 factor (ECF subfamily)
LVTCRQLISIFNKKILSAGNHLDCLSDHIYNKAKPITLNQQHLPADNDIESVIDGCIKAKRHSQKELYKKYYGFAMGICMRYCTDENDSMELVNDSFLKVYKSLHLFVPVAGHYERSFAGWLKSIVVHTAIDAFRKKSNSHLFVEVNNAHQEIPDYDISAIDTMSYKEIMETVQKLSPGYRTIFNLYVIDGYKHEEIAKQLNISVGASKSNLAKARINIQKMLDKQHTKFCGTRTI